MPTGDDVFSSPPDLSNHLVPNTFVSNAYNPIINVQYCAYGRSYDYSHLHLDRHLWLRRSVAYWPFTYHHGRWVKRDYSVIYYEMGSKVTTE